MERLNMSTLRESLDKIQAKISALRDMCDTVDGSPYNGTELPEAVTAVCQQMVSIEAEMAQAWVDMYGKSARIVKSYFASTSSPDMKTVHDFILVHAPELKDRLYWSENEKSTL